jgi:RNA polymerase sigma factor (sigma-70 family)
MPATAVRIAMENEPNTRRSLLLRLRGGQDAEAWSEFVSIYEPLVYRLVRKRGFQHADALELTQEVLLAVSRSIDRWDVDPHRGSFRGWLSRVSRNLMVNLLVNQRRHPRGVGDTDFQRLLAEQVDPACEESQEYDLEHRRSQFRWAAARIRHEFRPATWQAFWKTCVDGLPIRRVADELGMSAGAIYVARSRVMARLRGCVSDMQEGQESGPMQGRHE